MFFSCFRALSTQQGGYVRATNLYYYYYYYDLCPDADTGVCREQNMGLYAVFIDLTKAFDTVSRDGLWKILGFLARLCCGGTHPSVWRRELGSLPQADQATRAFPPALSAYHPWHLVEGLRLQWRYPEESQLDQHGVHPTPTTALGRPRGKNGGYVLTQSSPLQWAEGREAWPRSTQEVLQRPAEEAALVSGNPASISHGSRRLLIGTAGVCQSGELAVSLRRKEATPQKRIGEDRNRGQHPKHRTQASPVRNASGLALRASASTAIKELVGKDQPSLDPRTRGTSHHHPLRNTHPNNANITEEIVHPRGVKHV